MSFTPRWIRCVLSVTLVAITLPLFAAGRDLAPRAIAPTAYQAWIKDVAYADDRYLAVWVEEMLSIGGTIRGSLLDGTGRRITEGSFPIATTRNGFRWMELVAMGDSFALFSSENDGVTSMIRVDREGKVISRAPVDIPDSYPPEIAWNGTRFLVASGSSARFVDGDGRSQGAPIELPAFTVLVASRSDGFLVMTQEPLSGELSVILVDESGQAMPTVLDRAAGPGRMASGPYLPVVAILSDGRAIVVWAYGNPVFFGNELRSVVISADGAVSDKRVALTAMDGISYPIHLVPAGAGGMLILGNYSGLTTVITSPDGEVVSTPRTPVPAAAAAVADNGSSAVVIGWQPSPYKQRANAHRVGSDGTIGDAQLLALMPARQTQPSLTWGGDRLLAAWTDVEGDAAYVRSAAVTAEGEPASHHTVAPAFFAAQDLAWNGAAYLAVHYDNGRLRATRLDANGQPSGAPVILDEVTDGAHWSEERPVLVVWAGTQWMVVWRNAETLRVSLVPPSGDPTPARDLDLAGWARPIPPALALAFDGEYALLSAAALITDPAIGTNRGATTATLLSRDGEVVGQAVELPAIAGAARASIATSGDEFVVVARSTAVVVRRSGTFLHVGEVRPLRGDGDITWDGREYVTAHRRAAWQWTLEIQRFDRALNPIGEPRFVPTLPSDVPDRPSVAARAPHAALVAIQEGDGNGTRAVVYREDEFGPLPPLPPVPVNVRISNAGDGFLEITWEAPSHGPVEAYAVELLMPDGSLFRRQFVSPETRNFKTYVPSPPGPASIRVRASNANGLSEIPVRRRAVAR